MNPRMTESAHQDADLFDGSNRRLSMIFSVSAWVENPGHRAFPPVAVRKADVP